MATTVGNPPTRRAVILTALGLEFDAVRAHLREVTEETIDGTVYERGWFVGDHLAWEIVVVECGAGNAAAGMAAVQAISQYQPAVALFVGIAGGLKDVKLGDVVAATKVYGYESGKWEDTFRPRMDLHHSAHALDQRARAERRSGKWQERLPEGDCDGKHAVYVAPIAAGEKVIASTRSVAYKFLRQHCGDAVAVEMEGIGFLAAVHLRPNCQGLVVRGISDLLDAKSEADAAGSQPIAARNASAFAFQVLARLDANAVPYTVSGTEATLLQVSPIGPNPKSPSRPGRLAPKSGGATNSTSAVHVEKTESRQPPPSAAKTPAEPMHVANDRPTSDIINPSTIYAARQLVARYRELGSQNADNRRGIGLRNGLPDILWCEVPAGVCQIGGDSDAYQSLPSMTIDLPCFWIARFPVTNAQFAAFVSAPDGYANPKWWASFIQPDKPRKPYWAYSNHPRESVTWFEAVAFGRWLNAHRSAPDMPADVPSGYEVRLPTEQEWEKAARWPDGRPYPYGPSFVAHYGNTRTMARGKTSAVGLFPAGAAACGAEDMSGNVWEWTLSTWSTSGVEDHNKKSDYSPSAPRALRGGVWDNGPFLSRAASRHRSDPDFWLNHLGFRLVLSAPLRRRWSPKR